MSAEITSIAQSAGSRISGAGTTAHNRFLPTILAERPDIRWLELLADNYMAEGGIDLHCSIAYENSIPLPCTV